MNSFGYSALDGIYWGRGPDDDMPRYVDIGNDWVYDHVLHRFLRRTELEALYAARGLTLADNEIGPAPDWYEDIYAFGGGGGGGVFPPSGPPGWEGLGTPNVTLTIEAAQFPDGALTIYNFFYWSTSLSRDRPIIPDLDTEFPVGAQADVIAAAVAASWNGATASSNTVQAVAVGDQVFFTMQDGSDITSPAETPLTIAPREPLGPVSTVFQFVDKTSAGTSWGYSRDPTDFVGSSCDPILVIGGKPLEDFYFTTSQLRVGLGYYQPFEASALEVEIAGTIITLPWTGSFTFLLADSGVIRPIYDDIAANNGADYAVTITPIL